MYRREASSANSAQSSGSSHVVWFGVEGGVRLVDGERHWLRMESLISSKSSNKSSSDLRLVSAYGCCTIDVPRLVSGETLLAHQALAESDLRTKRNHCGQLLGTTYGTGSSTLGESLRHAQRFTSIVDVIAQSITVSISNTGTPLRRRLTAINRRPC
jgi:hypothetical protein